LNSVRVIAVGNELAADDGVGPAVIAELLRRGLPENVEALDAGADPLGVLEHLENCTLAVIIDAVLMGKPPGTVLTFPAARARVNIQADTFSLHGIGLAHVISLAEKMQLPAEIIIVGIQPETVEPGEQMSDSVKAAVSAAADAVTMILEQTAKGRSDDEVDAKLSPRH